MILRVGVHGEPVGNLHQALLEAGFTPDAGDLATATYGESTYRCVRAYQACHVGPDGHVLREDGQVGPATQWSLAHQGAVASTRFTAPGWRCSPPDARAAVRPVLEAAVCDLSRPTFEEPDGSNSGSGLERYHNSGQPWCAYAVSYWMSHAEGGSQFGVLASALKIYEWAQLAGRILGAAALPQPGDVSILLRADLHGHVELVCGFGKDYAQVFAIGGNVSNSVRGTVRPRGSITAFVRPIPLA